jgi:hypothetical protein
MDNEKIKSSTNYRTTFIKMSMERKKQLLSEKQQQIIIISNIDKELEELNNIMWKKCPHEWVMDWSCSLDDLSKKYCKFCELRKCHR